MKIKKNTVATMNYTLKDDSGTIIDAANDGSFVYLHGAQNIIPGLEAALEGKLMGDKVNATIEPKEAYGEIDPSRLQTMPRSAFPADAQIAVGMQFHGESPDGQAIVVSVKSIDGDDIVIDGNHELAGKTLHFEVEIVEVREATPDELAHGHIHGPGCNH